MTVAIPVLNEEACIEACLDAVAAQTYPHIIEVLVVDGGSTDRTCELAARPGVSVLTNPRRIQAAGLNVALDEARGDVFVRVDGHCTIAPDYVAACVEVLSRTGASLVGGAMSPRDTGVPMERVIAAAMTSSMAIGPARFHAGGNAGWVDTVYLGAFRTEEARRVGGYSERVGVNEDAEFAIRLGKRGGVWFEPSIRSSYVPRDNLRDIARQFRRYGWSRSQTLIKHPRSTKPRQLAPCALMVALSLPRLRRLVATAYLLALSGAGLWKGLRRPFDVMRFALVAGTMHLSWGVGFLQGIWRVVGPSQSGSEAE